MGLGPNRLLPCLKQPCCLPSWLLKSAACWEVGVLELLMPRLPPLIDLPHASGSNIKLGMCLYRRGFVSILLWRIHCVNSLIQHTSVFTVLTSLHHFPPNFFPRRSISQRRPYSLNHHSSLVDPITLSLLSKHAEKTLWRLPIFIFNIPHHADSLTPQNWNAVK